MAWFKKNEEQNEASAPMTLAMAARSNDEKAIRAAIEASADLDELDEQGFTALMIAAESGAEQAASMLLAAGANPMIWNPQGLSARGLAESAGFHRIAKIIGHAESGPRRSAYLGDPPAQPFPAITKSQPRKEGETTWRSEPEPEPALEMAQADVEKAPSAPRAGLPKFSELSSNRRRNQFGKKPGKRHGPR